MVVVEELYIYYVCCYPTPKPNSLTLSMSTANNIDISQTALPIYQTHYLHVFMYILYDTSSQLV